jgi:hypothetical protein
LGHCTSPGDTCRAKRLHPPVNEWTDRLAELPMLQTTSGDLPHQIPRSGDGDTQAQLPTEDTEGYRERCPAPPDSRAAHDIPPAKELLETLMADAAIILKQLSASLQRADTFTSIT